MLPKVPAFWTVIVQPENTACISSAVNEKCIGSHNDREAKEGNSFPLLVSSRNPQRDIEVTLQTLPYSYLGVRDIKLSHGNWA